MNIVDNVSFGLGFYDPISNGIREIKDDLHLVVKPFEDKTIKFYVYGTSIDKDSLITVTSEIESLVDASLVSLSFSPDKERERWIESDVIYSENDLKMYPLYITIQNKYYSELNTQLKIDLALHTKMNNKLTTLSYYGDLEDKSGYKVLSRPIENKSKRTLVIDPLPEGADYSYLSYSSGDTLIFLDNDTAIPYKATEKLSVMSAAGMSMPDAGYFLWDDGNLVDWDTDTITSEEQSTNIGVTSDEGIEYNYEDDLIEKGE